MSAFTIAKSELILGGQKSGKSRRAELLARQWLDAAPNHRAVLIATAQPWDEEMRQRIARHQTDRAERVPGMSTVEEPLALAEAIQQHSRPGTLVVVDCLTLWLTNQLMPAEGLVAERSAPCPPRPSGAPPLPAQNAQPPSLPEPLERANAPHSPNSESKQPVAQVNAAWIAPLLIAIQNATGPVVLVGNEIGLGVIPMGREVRAFVDALGRLNQDVAATCQRVTLMAAGLPLTLKDTQ
jgi:adenosylcobinamide kinase/adenosylcobinamide-phosphate guanylyltransferase